MAKEGTNGAKRQLTVTSGNIEHNHLYVRQLVDMLGCAIMPSGPARLSVSLVSVVSVEGGCGCVGVW